MISNILFRDVEIKDGFWLQRQKTLRDVTIKAIYDRFLETGRYDALRCAWREGQNNKPHIFWDSDIAKWIEAVAYLIQKAPMPEFENIVEDLIDRIEENQTSEGYFNSYFIGVEPAKRWQRRGAHELYCAGHLMEAAVAWVRATGKDRFLKIMCRYADYIDRVFEEDDAAAFVTPGHQEIELALVRLYEYTGCEKYFKLSRFFLERRGANEKDSNDPGVVHEYLQSHLPVRQQDTAVGHCVRACYLYAAMADMARLTGDEALLDACRKLFDSITRRQMYITGGLGSTHIGEQFTLDYDLPNQTAYAETCASIALAFFAQRMLQIEPRATYADIVERVIYNGALSGISLEGDRFFYSNPLEIDTKTTLVRGKLSHGQERAEWRPITQRVRVFFCSCCPPNVARFFASIGDYMCTEDASVVYVHQYMHAAVKKDGLYLNIETDYPVSGHIHIRAESLSGKRLALRIPSWCHHFSLNVPFEMKNGYAFISAANGVDIRLALDISPAWIQANPQVQADFGKVALTRGPVVYCLEGQDNGQDQRNIYACPSQNAEVTDQIAPGGLPVLEASGLRRAVQTDDLYAPYCDKTEPATLRFIPYFAFANRGEDDMKVWIPARM